MANKLFIIITVLFSAVLTTKAQVKVTARIDSAEILIGEQTSVHITVEHPQNVQPAFPKNVQQIMKKGVEVVKKETVTVWIGRKRLLSALSTRRETSAPQSMPIW